MHQATPRPARLLHLDSRGRSALFECGSLKVLRLKGSPLERAHAHGELLGRELSRDVLQYFSKKTREPFAALPRLLGGPLESLLARWMHSLHRGVDPELRLELAALASGAGIDENEAIFALSGPDLGSLSNAWQLNPALAWARLRFGCTTVSGTNRRGDFALARNLDFPGVGKFDAHPLVVAHLPEDGSRELKRISIAADGVHFASISAINEAGIGLVVHMNFTQETTTRSWPLLFIGDRILREATTLDHALSLLRKRPPGPMWTFVLFDVASGRTIAVEASRDRFGIRNVSDDAGCFSQTNHSLADHSTPVEFASHGTYANSCLRLETVKAMTKNVLDEESLIEAFAHVLAYTDSKAAPEPSIYDDIVKPITIQSVIFDRPAGSKLGQLWVSSGLAPSATGSYVRLDVEELLGAANLEAPPAFEELDLVKVDPVARENQMRLARASKLSFDERNDRAALEILEGLRSPALLFTRAVLRYRIGEFVQTEELARAALEGELPTHVRQSVCWTRALALLRLGREKEAQDIALTLDREGLANVYLAATAKRLALGKKLRGHELNLIFDFFAGDLVSPPQKPHLSV